MMMVLWRKEYSWTDKPTNRVFVYLGMKKLILLLFLYVPLIGLGQPQSEDSLTFAKYQNHNRTNIPEIMNGQVVSQSVYPVIFVQ